MIVEQANIYKNCHVICVENFKKRRSEQETKNVKWTKGRKSQRILYNAKQPKMKRKKNQIQITRERKTETNYDQASQSKRDRIRMS